MKTPDINPLVTGILALVGLAIVLGQYPKLEVWARQQAAEALAWKQGLPYFFAQPARAKKTKSSPRPISSGRAERSKPYH